MNLQPSLVRGRRLVLGIIAVLLALAVWSTIHYILVRGPDRLITQSVRFVIEVALFALLYRGHSWARWLTVACLGGAGILGTWNVATRLNWLLASFALAYLICALLLLTSPSVAMFLAEQDRKRQSLE